MCFTMAHKLGMRFNLPFYVVKKSFKQTFGTVHVFSGKKYDSALWLCASKLS